MNYQNYLFPLIVILFFGFRFYKSYQLKKKLPELLSNGAIIIDVRSESEFKFGANPNSVNIPLNNLNQESNRLDKSKTYILCCSSGTRSAMGLGIMKKNGFTNVLNAGSWPNTILK